MHFLLRTEPSERIFLETQWENPRDLHFAGGVPNALTGLLRNAFAEQKM